jgi:hypothetical protein
MKSSWQIDERLRLIGETSNVARLDLPKGGSKQRVQKQWFIQVLKSKKKKSGLRAKALYSAIA